MVGIYSYLFYSLFIVEVVVLATSEGIPTRKLHQSLSDSDRKVRNVRELENVLAQKREGETIVIDTDEPLILQRTLEIDTPGLVLRGSNHRNRTPTIICPNNSSSNALLIKGVDMTVASLSFRGCNGSSVVMIEQPKSPNAAPIQISFAQVIFIDNGADKAMANGTAISTICPTKTCIEPDILIRDCTFHNNHGTYGGAIFVKHANLNIQNSRFTSNSAVYSGGAISFKGKNGSLTVSDTHFHNNTAKWTTANRDSDNAEEFEFVKGSGGAIFAVNAKSLTITNSRFSRNRGCLGGGGLDVRIGSIKKGENISTSLSVVDCDFIGNAGYCQPVDHLVDIDLVNRNFYAGGAISYAANAQDQIDWQIRNTRFVMNTARYGGGLYLLGSPGVPLRLQGSTFEKNVAVGGGGAIGLKRASLEMQNTLITEGKAIWGGGLMIWENGNLVTIPGERQGDVSIIENGLAVYGGGIQSLAGGSIHLRSLIIRNNTAFRYGGGVRYFASSPNISFNGITFDGNRALVGGGIAFFAAPDFVVKSDGAQPTRFLGNVASVGGGLYFETGHYLPIDIKMRDIEFKRNRAVPMWHRHIQQLESLARTFRLVEGSKVVNPYDFIEHFEGRTTLDLLASVPAGQGGGLCITFANIQFVSVAEVQLQNVLIEDNEAVVGGGASLHFSELFWNNRGNRRPHCFPIVFGVDTCQRFYLSNVTIQRNQADFAGGLFTTHPDNILISCDLQKPDLNNSLQDIFQRTLNPRTKLDPINDLQCLDIGRNSISGRLEKTAADVGTASRHLVIESLFNETLKEVASGEKLAVRCEDGASDSSCSNLLRVSVLDAFRQKIRRGIDDAELELSLHSDYITGEVRCMAKNGTGVFNRTRARGIGVESAQLRIQSERDPRVNINVTFSTRDCYPGEFKAADTCQLCQSDVYSLNHSDTCLRCEDNALCEGGAEIAPLNGYWHSTPFSPQFHRCIVLDGCIYKGREKLLKAYYTASPTDLQQQLNTLNAYLNGEGPKPTFSTYKQCRVGYEGILCGSCQKDYGHGFTGACEKCPRKAETKGFFLGLAIFWTFVLIGINCVITLFSARARIQLVQFEVKDAAKNNRPRTLRRTDQHIRETHSIRAHLSRHTTLSTSSAISDEVSRRILTQHLVATVQLTETLKIFVNYLQITSSAGRLSVNWKSAMNGFLAVQAMFVGVTGDFVATPFECNFGNDLAFPSSILAVWMRILIPMGVMWMLVLLYIINWLVTYPKQTRNSGRSVRTRAARLTTGATVIAIVCIYFAYIDNVREFLRSLNCVPVDKDLTNSDHPYQKYAVDSGIRVWAEDTSMICFQGDHLFTGIVGIIGLFAALLAILFIIFWLPLNSKHVTKTEFIARYWFIYQAYRKEWYTLPWEAAILIRKALIATVLVFSFRLGPSMQSLLCVGTLILALVLQMSLRPFKVPENHENVPEYAGALWRVLHMTKIADRWIAANNRLSLNALESTSLFSSILVFYTATILEDPKASVVANNVFAIIAFGCNFLYFVFMLYRLYCGCHVLLDLKLELLSTGFMATTENSLGIRHFLKKIIQLILITYRQYFDKQPPALRTPVISEV